MTTQPHNFQSHNSPWTEMYEMHCDREAMNSSATSTSYAEEVAPTHDALADVYNRDDEADTYSKRF